MYVLLNNPEVTTIVTVSKLITVNTLLSKDDSRIPQAINTKKTNNIFNLLIIFVITEMHITCLKQHNLYYIMYINIVHNKNTYDMH